MRRREGTLSAPAATTRFAASCLATAVLVALPAPADVVQTLDGRLTGRAALRPEGVVLGERTVAAAELLFVNFDRKGRTFRRPNTVRLTNGEVWRCDILSLTADKLKVRSPFFGTREVRKADVRALEFQARLPSEAHLATNTLYRTSGEPLPGSLLWISPTQIAVDSPLGALAMDRKGATRFLLAGRRLRRGRNGEGEVVLVDGTVLRGRLGLAADVVRLTHDALGELALPVEAVLSFLRHGPNVIYLAELPFEAKARSLLGEGGQVRTVDRHLPGQGAGAAGFLRSLAIQPATALTVRLPDGPGRRVLRACAAPVPGARGAAILRVRQGERLLFEKSVPASQARAVPLSVELPAGDQVTIDVSFDRRVRLPCGVVLADPHVVTRRR